jgi:hypothetical protein
MSIIQADITALQGLIAQVRQAEQDFGEVQGVVQGNYALFDYSFQAPEKPAIDDLVQRFQQALATLHQQGTELENTLTQRLNQLQLAQNVKVVGPNVGGVKNFP